MKKIFLILMALCAVLIHTNKADASVEASDYVNLLEVNNLKYDSGTGSIGSSDYIPIKAGTNYTFIATHQFFGSACESSASSLIGESLGVIFKDANGESVAINTMLRLDGPKLYYTTINSTVDGQLLFTDMLVRDRSLDDLLTEQYIFYQGTRYNFKGFKQKLAIDKSDYSSSGDEISVYTDYDNPISVEELQEHIIAYDANDGLLADTNISVTDNYTDNFDVGVHEVLFQAKDQMNNTKVLKVLINVLDRTSPVIKGVAEIPWDMSKSCPTINDLKQFLTVSDNADKSISTDDIFISSSSLASYEVGVERSYVVTFAVKDESNNVGYYNAVVTTVDTEAPILEVKDISFKLSEAGEYLFRDLYKKVIVSISDNSGKYNLSYAMTELYGNGGFSGEYTITLRVTDAAGNATTKTATITIIDDIAPEIYIKSFLLETSTENPYSTDNLKKEIKRRLDARGILYDDVSLISSDYFSNEKTIGTYEVKYAYSFNGQTNYEIATINVVEADHFNYVWLCLLLIPAAVLSGWLFVKKRKKRLD